MKQKSIQYLLVMTCVMACNACSKSVANEKPKPAKVYEKGAAYDCTGVEIEALAPQMLTKKEQIERLDDSLVDSVDRYSECVSKVQNQLAAAGGGDGAGGGAEGSDNASSASEGNSQSSGNNGQNGKNAEQISDQNVKTRPADAPQTPKHQGRGAGNTLIPPKDNDNIVCTMIWEEIKATKDQKQKAGLTKQYNDLKCGQ